MPYHPVSALGHVSDPVWEVTWGPVLRSPLHLLVPVCAVCNCAFPLQDPTGLQPGENSLQPSNALYISVINLSACYLFTSPPNYLISFNLLFILCVIFSLVSHHFTFVTLKCSWCLNILNHLTPPPHFGLLAVSEVGLSLQWVDVLEWSVQATVKCDEENVGLFLIAYLAHL